LIPQPLIAKVATKLGEMAFNGIVAQLPNRGFRRARVAALRLLGASIGSNVRLSRNIKVLGPRGLSIEDDVSIANSVLLDARAGIVIERGALIGFESIILSHTHAWPDPHRPVHWQGAVGRSVRVGAFTWLGMRVMVLPGATVGRASVVGAGSVVTKTVPDGVVAAGNPCITLKARVDKTGE
jgi:acetyltransferase-like isoleucine patch superfamily enzyme